MIPKERMGPVSRDNETATVILSPDKAAQYFTTSIEDIVRKIGQPNRISLLGNRARHALLTVDGYQTPHVYTVHGKEAGIMTDPIEAQNALIELMKEYGFNEQNYRWEPKKTGDRDKKMVLSSMFFPCPNRGLVFIRDTAAHFVKDNPESIIHSIKWYVSELAAPPSLKIDGKAMS